MKRFIPLVLLACVLVLPSAARAQQKIAYVDIAAIMKALPEAQEAQRQLDGMVETWQKELERLEKEWQQKFDDYDKRKLILTEQGRANAERELREYDARIMNYRNQKFGQSGELFTKEEELMKPIQNLVFEQVNQLGKELGYDYVFDKSGGVMIIYANPAHDLTAKAVDRIKKMLPARETPASQQMKSGQQGQPGQQPMQQPGQQPMQQPGDTRQPFGK